MGEPSISGEKDTRLESEIQADVIHLARAAGVIVRVFGKDRKRKTNNEPGVPDLYMQAFWAKQRWWFETKRYRNSMTPSQKEFKRDEESAGGDVIVGGVKRMWEKLASLDREMGGSWEDWVGKG